MKLFEFEAKKILAEHGIPTPRGALASSPAEALKKSLTLKPPFVVKAQVLVAGRGKAGGIQFATTVEQLSQISGKILEMEIKGLKVERVLIEEKARTKSELYFGIAVDRSRRCYVAIASTAGGMNIEEVAARSPERIIKLSVDPIFGFRNFHATKIASDLGYSGKSMMGLAGIFHRLYRVALEYDAELIEMNPLVETDDEDFVAVDARIIMDDNALYRHPNFRERLFEEKKTELTHEEIRARKAGLAYVKLEGDIGIMGNGAGLVMATLDTVQLHGGKPANFLDVGGGASVDRVAEALKILLSDPRTSVVLINILGGITRCDDVAKGILEAKTKTSSSKPIVIRLVGTNEEEGQRILTQRGIRVLNSMDEAAREAVKVSRKKVS
ncbi:ADP-forming succinate--CoA ligase subunit beta [Candidatus Bathyarchaeota archaeon]|nr:ADP-forming succinate--CoA ligase subunit beta [Candidatus Bathyarchaeota archaeon]